MIFDDDTLVTDRLLAAKSERSFCPGGVQLKPLSSLALSFRNED
jgi:hypothetical protein